MATDFPLLIGRIALTPDCSLRLPLAFKQRMEDGDMVLWRPGFTIWLCAWKNDAGETIATRKAHVAATSSRDKFDEREFEEAGRLYYSYRLNEESNDERAPALYAFSFAHDGHLQLSFYFDREMDAELAYDIFTSVNADPATLANNRVYSQMCFATDMVMQDGRPVSYMYREEPDSAEDSGWRFFSGHESQDYVDDPANTKVYPVAFVAQSTPEIIPHLLAETGSQFERDGAQFVPCENAA